MRRGGGQRPGPRRRRRAAKAEGRAIVETLEITGALGSHAVEALQLELRRLARRCGLEITAVRIETKAKKRSG